jgi:hypothetical protein
MGRVFGMIAALVVYLSVATVLAAGAGLVYLRASGKLDEQKLARIVALVQGLEQTETPSDAGGEANKNQDAEQPSYDDREKARQLHSRQLEMRELALKSGLERIRFEQRVLTEDKDRYERLKVAFEEQLAALRDGAKSSGRENIRLIWENIKPKLAKAQILEMLQAQEINEVVAILSAVPIARRAKIISEFKTPDEEAKLDEILRLIRQGVPETNLIDKTRSQIQEPQNDRQ